MFEEFLELNTLFHVVQRFNFFRFNMNFNFVSLLALRG